MKSVLKVKSKNTLVTQEKIEPKYVEDKATEQYLDYINESGNVMRHNGDKYVNTGINLKGPRGAVGPRGLPGKDGITPHIGENGNWYIGELDTGNKAAFDLTFTETTDPANGHEYVDLGLPSGTLWATCNVGASSPEEYGNYYMYGMGSKTYDAADTPYYGTEDPLDLGRDTARQVMGGAWCMPTEAQVQELTANTTYEWVTDYNGSGINGGLFTATNGKCVFLPATGSWDGDTLGGLGSAGGYWCSSPYQIDYAYFLGVNNRNNIVNNTERGFGSAVRGVLDATEAEPTTTTYTANRVVIPIDSSKNAAEDNGVINSDTVVPYITDTENYLVIKESENLHSGTVIVEANLSGKGLCCPANMMYKEGLYYIYPSLPLDNIKDNLKDLILYCYLIEDYVVPVTAHKLWFDDFPEDKLEDIMDFNGLDNWEDFVAYLVNNVNKDGNRTGANGYIYTGETFNWNGSEYYLWETDGVNSTGVPYIITDTIDYNELYPNSLEADSSNKYCPYVGKLSSDMEVIYTRDDDDILIKVEPKE